jgi:hypothetical protein
MFRGCRFLFLLALLCAPGRSFAEGGRSADFRLVVSVFNDAEVDAVSLAKAEGQAAKILRHAHVEMNFLDCKKGGSERCLQPDDGHFALRIVRRSRNLWSEAFGVAFLDEVGHGTQADVFFDEVQRLGTNAKVDVSELLGHVIAHELGHLILGSHAHSASGIMSPRWEAAELNQLVKGNLLFNPAQAEVMRKRMRTTAAFEAASLR